MELQALPPGEITSSRFPPPPPVHWLVLLVVPSVIATIAGNASTGSSDVVNSLLFDAWSLYFCFWMRRLNPQSNSYKWCLCLIAVGLMARWIAGYPGPNSSPNWVAVYLTVASISLYLIMIYTLRAELLHHYNKQEPVGLTLGPWMTLFFSFIYFQYHLYPIAQFKDRLARGDIANAGRTFLP